ncbi:MAG: sterol desaturase family protein [Deltaproteobacteria bacterium]|nr:sterol desaturase family protein [Deltaproteobacteria bacterium]
MWLNLALPTWLTIVSTVFFLVLERVAPGRELPKVRGWYLRALAFNLVQLLITLGLNRVWKSLFSGGSLLHLAHLERPWLEGLIAWLVGTFFFYWWHRLRHANGFWAVFHQLHHSPARIEVATSFYKHPVEIFVDAALAAVVLYPLLGVSLGGAFWNNFFAATGEYLYHGNFRSPRWLRYFVQTPELHSIHHQLDVHRYNFSDLTLWDRLFGTYKDTTDFVAECGFPRDNERYVKDMLLFRDVYDRP